MDKRIDLFNLYKNEGKLVTMLAYPAIEIVDDPMEKNKSLQYLNPLPIKALVSDEGFSSLKFKYFGELPYGSVKIICERKHEKLLKLCYKLKIDDNYYTVYKNADRGFAILKRENYLVCIAELKNDA